MCLISVIVVNWNGKQFLGDCLDALVDQDFVEFEVILVDNGSVDGSSLFVQSNYPNVKLVQLLGNRGFTGGNLAGFEVAKGAFVALLNNDARPEKQWLSELYAGISSDAVIGICASRIVIEGTGRIDSIGDVFTTAFTGTKLGNLQNSEIFSSPRLTHGACAAAALYRRKMFDDIGFFDDDFYFNHEDTDLNLRAWLAGWKCLYQPNAIVHHKVSASIGRLSPAAVYYFSRNIEWVWLKNVPIILMIRYFPQRILYELFSFAFYGIKSGQLLPFLKGKLDAFKMASVMLDKRRVVQKNIRISSREIAAGLLPITSYLRKRFLSDT